MKKRFFFFVSLLFTYCIFYSQDAGLISGLNARHFILKNASDTIQFLVIDSSLQKSKPVLIFCQGSKPIPLITVENDGTKFITPLTNFNYKKLAEAFHVVIISMPGIPVQANIKSLNKSYCVVTDTANPTSYPPLYLQNNYLEKYTDRTKQVIDFLYTQNWVNKNQIVLFGHSQGSSVALQVALNNNKVTKIAYASGNPLGRIDQLIREQRLLAQQGIISQQESQQQIQSIYQMWDEINKAPLATTTEFGDPNRTWTSFSKLLINDLLKITQPLYVVYGTEDITSAVCDVLPVYFTAQHKTNLQIKPYVGLEHNFFEIDKTGKPNYTKSHWQQVIDDFVIWAQAK